MLIKIHPATPSSRHVQQVVDILNNQGVIIYPTDTVYALACAIDQKTAFEKICRIRNVQPPKAKFSLLFEDLSQVAQYTIQTSTPQYRLLKRHLPGPFTFILRAGSQLPPHLRTSRKTLGIRIPDHNVSTALVKALGRPLITTSLHSEDEILEYFTDPEEIHYKFGKLVDVVIDAGAGTFEPSTVVDLTGDEAVVLREGKGTL